MSRFLVCLMLVVLCAAPSRADDDGPTFLHLYSNICINRESGDLHGIRIGILDLADANYVFFQTAESWTQGPQIIQLPARVLSGSKILSAKLQFSVTGEDHKRHVFRGTITDTSIVGDYGVPDIEGKRERHLDKMIPSKNYVANC